MTLALRAGLVLLAALVLQAALVSQLGLFGAHGDVLLLVPVCAALTGGADRGAVAGFAAGLLVDLLVPTPFGLTALTYCLAGYGVGAFQSGVLRATWALPIGATVAAAAFASVFYALAATVVGETGLLDAELLRIIAAVAFVGALLVLPALRVARWVERAGDRRLLVGMR